METVQVAVLPLISVAVQMMVLIPLGRTAPARVDELLKLLVNVTMVQLSLDAVGLNSVPATVYVHTPAPVFLEPLAAHVMVGT